MTPPDRVREVREVTVSAFVPTPREDSTIAEDILAQTAQMRKAGTFGTTSLCWSPAHLERLAMFAIDAKHQLARLRAEHAAELAALKHDLDYAAILLRLSVEACDVVATANDDAGAAQIRRFLSKRDAIDAARAARGTE